MVFHETTSFSGARQNSSLAFSISPRFAYAPNITFQHTMSLWRHSSNIFRAASMSPLAACPAMIADHATTSPSPASSRRTPAALKSPHLESMLMSAFLTYTSFRNPSFTTAPWTWHPTAQEPRKPTHARSR
uniref:Uncharacterized protein n=1 Tax=Leersia perrieri TaxID=77586 RepID=A0A0D9WNL2_9ORYZ